ncbi:hypothetical protein R6Z07M_009734 [Ovis aries]
MQAPGDHCGFGIELCFPSRPPFLVQHLANSVTTYIRLIMQGPHGLRDKLFFRVEKEKKTILPLPLHHKGIQPPR